MATSARSNASSKRALKGETRYEKIQDLYSGSDGCIKLCVDKVTGERVAIKYIERGAKVDYDLKCGILNHMGLVHQHVILFKEVFLTSTHLCVVMEYGAGGDILEFVRCHGINEVQARWLFQQLIVALDHCHNMNIVLREIKLETALLDHSNWPLLKLNAFRFSKRLGFQDAESLLKPRGSPAYLAPELIDSRAMHCCSSFKATDLWECGIFLYAMLFQSYPFCHAEDKNEPDQLKTVLLRTLDCKFSFPKDIPVSEECKDLISRILTHPKERITLKEIIEHPWFAKDLPPGAMDMNQTLRLRKGTKLQSKKEIEKILDDASVPAT